MANKKPFDRLPANYREAIERVIATVDGGKYLAIADAYRQAEAESLLECEISRKDTVDQQELETHYTWFREGYQARLIEVNAVSVTATRKIHQLKAILDSQEHDPRNWTPLEARLVSHLAEFELRLESEDVVFVFDSTGEKFLGLLNWKE